MENRTLATEKVEKEERNMENKGWVKDKLRMEN